MEIRQPSVAQQLIEIQGDSLKLQNDINVAILKKQNEADKAAGNVILALLQSAVPAAPSKLDVRA